MKYILLLLSLLGFSSCTTIKILNIVNQKSLFETGYYYVIPFECRDNMILVRVKVADSTYPFIFDTGAFTVLSDEISGKLNLTKIKGPRILDSQGNKQSIYFTTPDTLSVDQLDFIKPGCGIFNFKNNPELSCFNFDGILGANLFTHSVLQINFTNNTLIVTDNIHKLPLPDGTPCISFRKHITGQPIVKMTVDGVTLKNIILDYGSGSGFNLSSPKLIHNLIKDNLPVVTFEGYNAVGLFGKQSEKTYYYKSHNISIEDMKIESDLLILSEKNISTIGVKFLKNYIVTLDFQQSKIYFEHHPLEEKEELYSFGLTPVMDGNKLIVSGIFRPSPAQDAGIHKGDQIISVNNVDYSNISASQYCEILKNGIFPDDKDTTVLQLQTDKSVRTVKLIKRQLTQ